MFIFDSKKNKFIIPFFGRWFRLCKLKCFMFYRKFMSAHVYVNKRGVMNIFSIDYIVSFIKEFQFFKQINKYTIQSTLLIFFENRDTKGF